MSPKYEHTQKPGVPFFAALIVPVVIGVVFFNNGIPPIPVLILVVCLLFYLILMMSSLTVTIDDQYVHIRFGPGVFYKKFPISEITGIGPKFSTYIWGWGIRWYPMGWLYNIAGFKSVEIVLKDGRKRRIGTDEPEKLAEAIKEAIKTEA